MNAEDFGSKPVSRRQVLRAAALGGVTAAAASVVGPLAIFPPSVAAQEETPEGFLASAYAYRAQAMTTKNVNLLEGIYDTANTQLLAFEKDRAAFFADLGSRWNGILLGYDTNVSLLSLQFDATSAQVRLYEVTRIHWIPAAAELTTEEKEERRREPERFTEGVPRGPRGDIFSALGTRHEVLLERHRGSWRLVKDAYDELDMFGVSPDLVPGSWAAVRLGTPSNGDFRTSASVASAVFRIQTHALVSRTYNRTAAKDYANRYCASYNPNYCNFNSPCGGDCANFVSQCFRAGNQVNDTYWKTYNGTCGPGTCPTKSSANAGTDHWANNRLLRDWILNSSRGDAKSGITSLGVGDVVNYDWGGDGTYDHITIVTDAGTPRLVCSHNYDRCNVEWTLGGARSYLYTAMRSTYLAD